MTAILADVIRLEVPTQAEITGGSPPAVKLKQQIHALDTANFYYKDSTGTLRLFYAAMNLASQASALLGSGLIGDVGVPGVTPSGGALSGPGTVHALLIGLKNYADSILPAVQLDGLFQTWDEETPYSQNEVVFFAGTTYGNSLAISNVPGEGTNTGNDPNTADLVTEFWTIYPGQLDGLPAYPLGQIVTMILNTKANA